MFQSGKDNTRPPSVKYMDVRSTLLSYLSDVLRSHRKALASEILNLKDVQSTEAVLMTVEDETRRQMRSLGNFDDVREMLEVGGSMIVKVTDADGNSLLSRAAKEGHDEILNWLLKYGSDVNHQNSDLNTPLLLAVDQMHETIVSSLIQAGAHVDCVNNNFETPLKLTASNGNTYIANCLLQARASPNYMSNPGDTALTRACSAGNISIVEALLVAGANVNSMNNIYRNGQSPLMIAAKCQNIPIVRLLLQAGADINSPNNLYEADDTLLIHITRLSLVEIMHIFILAGADVGAKNALGQSALTVAIRYRKNDAVKCLLAHGADVNQRTKTGDTPLVLAAENGNASLCKEFINRGADLDAVNDHGDSALIQAARNGHCDVMNVLIDAGVDINHVNNSKMSALRFAVGQSLFICSPCLMCLLEAGIRIHSELHYAVTLGLTHVVKQFLTYNAMPLAIEASCLSFIPSLPQLSFVSPMCVALITERVEIVQHILDMGFLTDFDLKVLHGHPGFRRYLKDNSRSESLHFLDFVLPVPMSLHSLSLLVVSRAIGFNSLSRQARITGTGLPPFLQRKLMFVS